MMNTIINTESLCAEIGVLVQTRLTELLGDYSEKYQLYESVYNHIASLNLSKNTNEVRNEANNNDFYKLILDQLNELKSEVQSLKRDAKDNISLIIQPEVDELTEESLTDEDSVKEEEDEEEEDEEEEDEEEEDEEEEDEEEEEEEQVSDELEQVSDELEQVSDELEQVSDELEEEEESTEIKNVVVEEIVKVEEILSVSVDEEDEEYTEIEIDGISYCTNNEIDGFIYAVDDDGSVGKKVGYIKNEEPFFY